MFFSTALLTDRGTEQGSSESEEERPWRRGEPASQTQKTSSWGSSGNKPSEKEAYNSRAPAVQGRQFIMYRR